MKNSEAKACLELALHFTGFDQTNEYLSESIINNIDYRINELGRPSLKKILITPH